MENGEWGMELLLLHPVLSSDFEGDNGGFSLFSYFWMGKKMCFNVKFDGLN